MRTKFNLFISILFSLLLWHCANIGQIDGGARDTTAPVIDSLSSTKMLQTNYRPDLSGSTIEINFNEWIKLQDAQKQIVVSPPLQYSPEVIPKGKGIRIKFDPREKLLENTTYTINFGDAIRDLTEGNEVKNMRFVFSTGAVIDSSKISGKIIDAYSKETKEDILVMLYFSDSDTVITKSKPIYFSRSDKDGRFTIENIRDTSYKLFVLNDANSNYIYDQDKEEIGFFHRRVETGEDSATLIIPYFKSFVKSRLLNTNFEKTGVVKLVSNVPSEELQVISLDSTISLYPLISKDSLHVYYTPAAARGWNLLVRTKDTILDTILINRVRVNTIDSIIPNQSYKEVHNLAPNQKKILEFNQPIKQVDTSRVYMINDSTKVRFTPQIIFAGGSDQISIICPCAVGDSYSFRALPLSIKGIFDQYNSDTIKIKIRGMATEQYGTMIINTTDLDTLQNYYISLLLEDKELYHWTVKNKSTFEFNQDFILPGSYSLSIIQDENGNKKWDTGDYKKKIQPEKIYIQNNFNVRANWELREEVIWKP